MLSVKVNAGLAVKVECTTVTTLIARKGKHGQRYWNRNVNANLPCFDRELIFAGGRTIIGKESSTITVSGGWGCYEYTKRLLLLSTNVFLVDH